MDLPTTTRPSPLSPHFFYRYVKFGVPALLIAAVVVGLETAGFLGGLPFPPLTLLLVTLPLVGKIVQAERERRHYEYEFRQDRVTVRRGRHTIREETVPYDEITDISSESPPWEQLVDVGDLHVHLTGADSLVTLIGLRHPDRYQAVLLDGGDTGGEAPDADQLRQRLEDLEQEYESGEIGRAEYERQYYYLEGKIDALEGAG